MTLNETQQQVEEWVSQYKIGYFQPLEILARIIEEVGEVSRELNHMYGPKKKKATEDNGDLEEEIGDILFAITCLANREGLSLDNAFKKAMDKCY
ncbi:MAG: NTP pyrophosphatase (non-canonical NTP hydrolase), partial [Patescibacteria group bacterium]